MSLWKRLFRQKGEPSQLGTDCPGYDLIQEASRIADQGITLQQKGTIWSTATNTEVGASLVAAITDALEASPRNADLLVAKYAALTLSSDPARAPEVLAEALSLSPTHLDARMLRDHASTWQHLFHFPAWSEERRVLSPPMREWLRMRQSLQIVRDGLSLGLAVVNPASAEGFPSRIRRSGWKLVWSKTPHGPIAFHYALLDCGQGDIRKQESGIPHVAEDSPTVRSGYWILKRLAHLESIFIVFADDAQILHNVRYEFPASVRNALKAMGRGLEKSGPVKSVDSCQAAASWYTENIDFESITF